MLGFLLAALPAVLLGLGGVEVAHWMSLRQTLSLALIDAARAGTTQQGAPEAIAAAFEAGLRFSIPDPGSREQILARHARALGTPWVIRILSPDPGSFLDHADPMLSGAGSAPGRPTIRNDYQAQQHQHGLAQGWPQGRGPRSDTTIFEANTLTLALWWPHRPRVPGLSGLIRQISPWVADPDSAHMMAHGFLPFRQQASLTMQSHPVRWPALADGRVRYGQPAAGAPTPWAPAPPDTPPTDAAGRGPGRGEAEPFTVNGPEAGPTDGDDTAGQAGDPRPPDATGPESARCG